jgi:fructokinase
LIDLIALQRDVPLSDTSSFCWAAGGAPANVAAGVTKLGFAAGFIGKVGDDPFGDHCRTLLKSLGVDTSFLMVDHEARTTLSFVGSRSDGTRDCMFYRNPGADMLLDESEINEEYVRSAKIFHFGSISLGSTKCRAATVKALEIAKAHGSIISYDPNLRLSLWSDEASARREILFGMQFADIVKISEEEHQFVTGCATVEDSASFILGKGPRLVIVTLGKNGCYYTNGVRSGHLGCIDVKTVDTTGAGDAFVASLLAGVLKFHQGQLDLVFNLDGSYVRELARCNVAGTLATMKHGAIPALPTTEEINRFITGHGL